MTNDELMSARVAMNVLGIGEAELQSLVVRGELRAFRSAGTMKFRCDDVLALKMVSRSEPVDIIPATGSPKPGQSGILSIVDGAAGSSELETQVATRDSLLPADLSDQTGEIILEESMPIELDFTPETQTCVITVVDELACEEEAIVTGALPAVNAVACASRSGPKSNRRSGEIQVNRDRQQVMSRRRRTATVFEVRSGHPVMAVILLSTTCIFLFAASIFCVMEFKGHIWKDNMENPRIVERIIPPYLGDGNMSVWQENFYGHWFGALPGRPMDHRPESEPDPGATLSPINGAHIPNVPK